MLQLRFIRLSAAVLSVTGLLASVTRVDAQAATGRHGDDSASVDASAAQPARSASERSKTSRSNKAQASSSEDPTLGGANVDLPLPPGYVPPPPHARAVGAPPSPTRERAATSHPGFGVVEIEPDRNGQYQTDMEIQGTPLRALVDTGATFVALTAEDARQLDIDPPPSAFNIRTHTANGTGMVAHVRLRQISVGDITVYDVDAVVAKPAALHVSLLGMSFLKKLESFQFADGRLVMKQ